MEVASVEENHLGHAPFVQEFLAGTVGGCCEVLVGHPFDSVKVRMQTQPSKNPIYSGAVDCFRKVVAKEKFTGLYRGVTPPLVTVGFCSAIIFSSNGYFRRMLNPDPSQPLENLSIWRTGVAGAMTGCIIACFYCPMEFLKIRMQTQTMFNAKYSSMGDCAKQIISKHGAMTLYRGFLPTLLRDSACFAGYFMCYNTMKSYYLKNHSKDGEIPLWYLLFSGGMSGISCWLTSYPQDIIKSNMQTSNERVTVRQVIRRIYGDMGVRGFFKGFAPTLLRSFPANGATFFGYELALSVINKSS